MIQTALLKARKQHMAKIGFPWQIWTNYWVRFADYKSPRLVDRLLEYPEEARNLTLGIDEIQSFMSNRRSVARVNLDYGTFLTQIRKRHIEIVSSTQFPSVIDIQTLLQYDLFVRAELWKNGKSVKLFVYDYWGQYTGNDYRKVWPPRPDEFDWVTWVHGTDSIFGDYNTEEVIAPIWSSNREEILRTEGYTPKDVAEGLLGGEEGLGAEEADRRRKLVFRSILDGKAAFSITDTLPEARDILGLEWGKVGREQYVAWLEAHEYRIFEDGRRQLMGQRKDLEPGEGGVAPKTPDKDEGPDAEDIWGGEQ